MKKAGPTKGQPVIREEKKKVSFHIKERHVDRKV